MENIRKMDKLQWKLVSGMVRDIDWYYEDIMEICGITEIELEWIINAYDR